MEEIKATDENGDDVELTAEQKQVLQFQNWLKSSDGQKFMKDFGADGKYGESIVNFKLGLKPKGFFAKLFENKGTSFATTTAGKKGSDLEDQWNGLTDIKFDFGIERFINFFKRFNGLFFLSLLCKALFIFTLFFNHAKGHINRNRRLIGFFSFVI